MPKKFEVNVPYSGSLSYEVIAESEEQAIELANGLAENASGRDFDDAEIEYSDTEVFDESELTKEELAAWHAEQKAKAEAK